MKESLKNILDLFVYNKNAIANDFKWDNSYLYPACSLIYTKQNLQADVKSIKQCCNTIKSNTGAFSPFRGISKLALAANLSLEENPEEMFSKYLKAYECLKGLFGLGSSTYLPFSAAIIAKLSQDEEYKCIAEKAGTLFNLVKKQHPVLTSGEDAGYAVLLALSDVWGSSMDAAAEVERCYSRLKSICLSSNSIQSLAFVLALSPENADLKCAKAIELFNAFKESRHKYGTSYELASLGVIASSSQNVQSIVDETCQADDYLKNIKGFGNLRFGSKMRLMYSAILVSTQYGADSNTCLASTVNSVTSMMIAQQTAIISAMVAASAAASASSSSS